MTKEKVLVVAFDGLDYELIQDYDLKHIPQEEFGSIDNDTGVKFRYTSELFASFITGSTYEDHGVVKLCRSDSDAFKRRLRGENFLPNFLIRNVRGFTFLERTLKGLLERAIPVDDTKYTKEDLEEESLFEKVELAKPLYVPSYNPDPRWQLNVPHGVAKYEGIDSVRDYSKKLTESRLSDFRNLTFDFWNFIMLHLHDPDPQQDLELGGYREDYERLDTIAGEIIDMVPDEWTIIFMSDHGLMEEKEHNKNAFYSCNRELFPGETPHITDFHDKILELVG